jgi:FHS family L-fucose permease-like MFS transporter
VQIDSAVTSEGAPYETDRDRNLRRFIFLLFFAFGGITSLNDVLIPKLKSLFALSYTDVMLVQSSFFAAYLVVSIPAALLVRRIGYMRAAVVGLLTMMAGCLLFEPASDSGLFAVFLLAFFVLACGITTVQVVANPLISLLGPAASASSRLTFAQAFNSLGTTLFPYVGSMLILGSLAEPVLQSDAARGAFRVVETRVIVHTYWGLAAALAVLAGLVWSRRRALAQTQVPRQRNLFSFDLLRRPRFAAGALCIFLYVGAEVAIGSLIVNYLMQKSVLGVPAGEAGRHVPLYWGGAMIGRFIGAYILRQWVPGRVLAAAGTVVLALLLASATLPGEASAWSLLGIGLFNSIMFPTIFTLASEGLGDRAAEGSGIICMAIVGGAVIPPITGHAADLWGLRCALWVPALCYAGIVLYGWYASERRAAPELEELARARAQAAALATDVSEK